MTLIEKKKRSNWIVNSKEASYSGQKPSENIFRLNLRFVLIPYVLQLHLV